MILDKQQKQ